VHHPFYYSEPFMRCILFGRGDILCDMCIFVLCLIVVSLPRGKNSYIYIYIMFGSHIVFIYVL
jgi:hypothetical protein